MQEVLKSFDEMSRDELLAYLDSAQSEEGISLLFRGKDLARRIARRVQPRSSRHVAKYSVGTGEEQSRNLLLEGENLQALVTLYRERGQVDLIITDPPYNTGGDFRYNDRWDEDPNDPDLGELVKADTAGRHTIWMKFMLPRLQVMKSLLKPGGVLAICIDHRELFRLGQMLDEVFGSKNRIGIINWQKSYAPRNDNKHMSTATEYVLVYSTDLDAARTGLLERTDAMDRRYQSQDNDPRAWASDNPTAGSAATHQGMVYAIQSPFTGEFYYPPEGRCWANDKKYMKQWLEEWGSTYVERDLKDGKSKALLLKGTAAAARDRAKAVYDAGLWPRLYFTDKGDGGPRLKRYLDDIKKGAVPVTYWADEDYDGPFIIGSVSWDHEESGHTQAGVRELDDIVGRGHNFQTVKPLKLFTKIIQLWCPPTGLVVDPFAGSGTTGHAVLAMNFLTGAQRRFILIEQGRQEKGDPYARSLTANRLRRAVTGDWSAGAATPLGGGFRFVQLQKKVDAKALLGMERDEMTDTVIASHFDANQRGGPGLNLMRHDGYSYLVARNTEDEGFFLVWDGSFEPPVFNEEVYDAVVNEAIAAGLKPVYHVYARFNLYQTDDVRFYQIPDRILMDFGLQVHDAFNSESAEA